MAITQEQAEQIRLKLIEQIDKLPADQTARLREQIMAANPEQLEQYLQPQVQCLFCGIAQGNVETTKIFEDANVIAFLDITPLAVGQVIITPKEHYEFLFQIPDQVLWSIIKLMKLLTPLIVNVTSAQGVSTYIAQGGAAGQTIDHLSINLIPRFDKDNAEFTWERKKAEKEALETAAQNLMAGINKALKEEREKVEKVLREKMQAQKPVKSEDGEEQLSKSYYPSP